MFNNNNNFILYNIILIISNHLKAVNYENLNRFKYERTLVIVYFQ